MAPRTCSSLALFLAINILFFALVSARVKFPDPTPNPPSPKPKPKPSPSVASCPRDTIKLGVCSNVLNGMLNLTTGVPLTPCCSFFHGLADFDAAVCLCTALKGNILGINLNIPISLSLLLNVCSRQAPNDFQCVPEN